MQTVNEFHIARAVKVIQEGYCRHQVAMLVEIFNPWSYQDETFPLNLQGTRHLEIIYYQNG